MQQFCHTLCAQDFLGVSSAILALDSWINNATLVLSHHKCRFPPVVVGGTSLQGSKLFTTNLLDHPMLVTLNYFGCK